MKGLIIKKGGKKSGGAAGYETGVPCRVRLANDNLTTVGRTALELTSSTPTGPVATGPVTRENNPYSHGIPATMISLHRVRCRWAPLALSTARPGTAPPKDSSVWHGQLPPHPALLRPLLLQGQRRLRC